MKKPPLVLKAGQVWEGALRNGPRTLRRIAMADSAGVLWYCPGKPSATSATYYCTLEAFTLWAERLLP